MRRRKKGEEEKGEEEDVRRIYRPLRRVTTDRYREKSRQEMELEEEVKEEEVKEEEVKEEEKEEIGGKEELKEAVEVKMEVNGKGVKKK